MGSLVFHILVQVWNCQFNHVSIVHPDDIYMLMTIMMITWMPMRAPHRWVAYWGYQCRCTQDFPCDLKWFNDSVHDDVDDAENDVDVDDYDDVDDDTDDDVDDDVDVDVNVDADVDVDVDVDVNVNVDVDVDVDVDVHPEHRCWTSFDCSTYDC